MKFDFTEEKLAQLIPNTKGWYTQLSKLLPVFEINTSNRTAAFIANCSYESHDFVYLIENLNYSADMLHKMWPNRFSTIESANSYARKPEAIANRIYANRMGNGSEETGDGFLYRGRGLIKMTGKANYASFAQFAGVSLDDVADYIETQHGAIHASCWAWKTLNLNAYADADDITGLTTRLTGGTIGVDKRNELYQHALEILQA